MILYFTDSFVPAYNLACEEYYLNNSDQDIFMLWRNAPTVVIGRNQNIYAEVDLDYASEHGISTVRRITGGGAVYHDLGNVNYSFITSREKAQSLDFAYFTRPIIEALSKLGVNASLSGRNDLEADGLKFSGNAQYSTDERILHHGTLLFDSDLTVLSRVLRPDPAKLQKKAIQSVRSRVTNLKPLIGCPLTVEEFIESVAKYVKYATGAEQRTVDRDAVIKSDSYLRLSSDKWIFGRRKSFAHSAKYSFSRGNITVLLDTENGLITDAAIEGDFFGEGDVALLEAAVCGQPIDIERISDALSEAGIGKIIDGADSDDLARAFCEAG
ncbi:MAG: lipoate--protein ligase [Firmicutes bacterium]|nr:lipoate--protein ligase [Bacillota bacterium]